MNIQWMESIKENQMVLSESLFDSLSQPKVLTIHFGSFEIELNVLKDVDIKEETIGLPMGLSSSYTIPTELPYDCLLKEGHIYLGPIMAFIVTGTLKNYSDKTLSIYLPRFKEYEETKGLIFICTKESINVKDSRIAGYYYSPNGTENGGQWGYGEFPLPDVIFNRSFIKKRTISELQKKLGDVLFNSFYLNLDKWLIWRYLSKQIQLRKHLPYTEKYTDVNQLTALLKENDALYIKARRNSRGRGIFHLCRTNNGFMVRDSMQHSTFLENKRQLKKFLDSNIISPSIVQQPVPFRYGKRVLDFRVYLQKNDKKEWIFQGFTTRISKEDSVVTNTIGRENLLTGKEALSTIYQLDEESALRIENDMVELVKSAVQVYEERGMHIADIAADIILDDNLHLWLLELQLNYAAEKKAYEIPSEIFHKIMTTPFKYAKAITKYGES
ncbi:YheC/YheD family protein [Viridibacillus sp. NPDC093762]|uniref:YheC/YheD family protein n=1 Tax=Viridibacillus sp. NPDC093762 TaxID=3390720 RepID=UPI003D04C9C4